jgi:hypothetical protein
MAQEYLTLDLASALKRKEALWIKHASLPISEKMRMMDQLHDRAMHFARLRKIKSSRK